jgi:fatty-acyl-CoA synthase
MSEAQIGLILEMAAEAMPTRIAIGSAAEGIDYDRLRRRARAAADWLAAQPAAARMGFVGINGADVPVALFGSAIAGLPFVPISYRLEDEQLCSQLARIAPAAALTDEVISDRVQVEGVTMVTRDEFAAITEQADEGPDRDPLEPVAGEPCVLLFTSGTTAAPKMAILGNRNLTSYVFSTVEFMSADPSEAALISVPPYHIASISAVLTNVYAGRRLVFLPSFDAAAWIEAVRTEAITHAMVVPTMLGRILDGLELDQAGLPSLRLLSYGGGPMPQPVIERALARLPEVDFVNAYGLTETSSTIAVLGPEDHRRALTSGEPTVRRRLASVGRPLGSIELTIAGEDGEPLPAGAWGEILVRGAQVSGVYAGVEQSARGWFHTRDRGMLDEDGYLFLGGRMDDVIVRGGENLSPTEIEDVLLIHPEVSEAAVIGIPSTEWGEEPVAFVVRRGDRVDAEELRDWVRGRLRSARTPAQIHFRDALPYNDTGKLMRRTLREEELA